MERSSVPAAACGWCLMERHGAQRCSGDLGGYFFGNFRDEASNII